MKVQWRTVPEAGIELDGVWVPVAILGELEDRPQNTEITGQPPLLLDRHARRVLVAHGLATEQTRGGVYAGPELMDFMSDLEWTPRPEPGQ